MCRDVYKWIAVRSCWIMKGVNAESKFYQTQMKKKIANKTKIATAF